MLWARPSGVPCSLPSSGEGTGSLPPRPTPGDDDDPARRGGHEHDRSGYDDNFDRVDDHDHGGTRPRPRRPRRPRPPRPPTTTTTTGPDDHDHHGARRRPRPPAPTTTTTTAAPDDTTTPQSSSRSRSGRRLEDGVHHGRSKPDQRAVMDFTSLNGIAYNCLETFSEGAKNWTEWEEPWILAGPTKGRSRPGRRRTRRGGRSSTPRT